MTTTTSTTDALASFLAFSAAITGFSEFRLRGTGQAESYLATVRSVVGDDLVAELLRRYGTIAAADDGEAAAADRSADGDVDGGVDRHVRALRAEIFSDERLGPVARNLVKLWFVGTWYELPGAWRAVYGISTQDVTFVVSPAAYTEGLLWPTIGANPPGAKAPGYASWTGPPRIPDL